MCPQALPFKKPPTLCDRKIHNLHTLKPCLPGSVLVALDVESFNDHGEQNVSEIGLAVLHVHGELLPFHPGLSRFYEKNGVEALTIRLPARYCNGKGAKYEDPEWRYGDQVRISEEEAGDVVAKLLSKYGENRILVGFSMVAEWRWISENCPSLAILFSGWVDVQELVSQRREEEDLGPKCDRRWPGMTKTLRVMGIADPRCASRDNKHCPANDALRCLVILSGLIHNAPFVFDPPRGPKTPVIRAFNCLGSLYRVSSGFTAMITTDDRSRLPTVTPDSLAKLLSGYTGLEAVAVNYKWAREQRNPSGGKGIWLAGFRSQEHLEVFILDVDGSVIDGKQVRAVQQH
ncbi:hypothetical protein BDV96DRAFT_305601 [Lophiotrema nucula]|uniref:Uncharacterized protein n=1 Tax=Lophiotrema nucula TaxID=690887 RepID=A0A6A5YJH6_9PLEO|nr:hypothetical protein BDV96DRAFT_305601 [Lophiotrema nucula]